MRSKMLSFAPHTETNLSNMMLRQVLSWPSMVHVDEVAAR
jgi:hypothetical protein